MEEAEEHIFGAWIELTVSIESFTLNIRALRIRRIGFGG